MTNRELTYPDAVEFTEGAYVLRISYDTFSESPREWDNAGTLYTWERNYMSPDKCDYGSMEQFLIEWTGAECVECGYLPLDHINGWTICTEYTPDRSALGADPDAVLFLVHHNDGYGRSRYSVDNSPAELFTSLDKIETWKRADGVLFVTGETVRREWGEDTAKAIICLMAELETWTKYANGDVFTVSWERIDTCGECAHDERVSLESVSSVFTPFDPAQFAPSEIPTDVLAEIMSEFARWQK
jgi:hypothetical protein